MPKSLFSRRRLPFAKRPEVRLLTSVVSVILAISAVGVLAFAPAGLANKALAASVPIPVSMIDYGWHDDSTDRRIIDAHPEFIVSNSSAGPWRGNANISKFMSAGIKYFEYISGAYENTVVRSIPTDLQSNLSYVAAAAWAGAYGIFVDEVSDGIYMTPNYDYLRQIADKAHSLGLKVVFNTGMPNWADQLMNYCDYVNSSETWRGEPLTPSQSKWASRTWLLTYGINDATTAADLTIGAWNKGIAAQYACYSYTALPAWLEDYVAQIRTHAIDPSAPTVSTGGASSITTTSATLSGDLSAMGTASSVSVNFQWGPTTSYGSATLAQSRTTTGSLVATLSGLTPGTTYHYRAVASGDGTASGSDRTFTASVSSAPAPVPVLGNTTGKIASRPRASGGANEYTFKLTIISSTVTGVTANKQLWCAATTTDFPNLLRVGVTVTGNLDHSLGWWTLKTAAAVSGNTISSVDGAPIASGSLSTLAAVSPNTVGSVASRPIASGALNEYCFSLAVASTTVAGVAAGQQVWCAASTADFPNLLTVGATLIGNLDHSLGWWTFKKVE